MEHLARAFHEVLLYVRECIVPFVENPDELRTYFELEARPKANEETMRDMSGTMGDPTELPSKGEIVQWMTELEVSHIVPRAVARSTHRISNLVTLCTGCHEVMLERLRRRECPIVMSHIGRKLSATTEICIPSSNEYQQSVVSLMALHRLELPSTRSGLSRCGRSVTPA